MLRDKNIYGGKTPDLEIMLISAQNSLFALKKQGKIKKDSGQKILPPLILFKESFHSTSDAESYIDSELELKATFTKTGCVIELYDHKKPRNREKWPMEPIEVLYELRTTKSASVYIKSKITKYIHVGDGTTSQVKNFMNFLSIMSGE